MELDAGSRTFPLASSLPDVGLGSVWPTAVLTGASLAAAGSAGAWVGGLVSGAHPSWSLAVWSAEHALWGTAVGALVSLALRVAGRRRPGLADPVRRRALAWRATRAAVGVGLVLPFALILALNPSLDALRAVSAPLTGVLAGVVLWAAIARRARGLPRLDPARVAALLALVTLPLANAFEVASGAPTSLVEVWRTLLTP